MKRVFIRLFILCLVGSWAGSAIQADGPGPFSQPEAVSENLLAKAGNNASDLFSGHDGSLTVEDQNPFRAGAWSFEFLSGYFVKSGWGPGGKPGINPPLDYVPEALRVGLMCNDPIPDWCGLPIGVIEILLEYNYLSVVRGIGDYFTGPNALLRYNLPLPGWALVPYGQIGAGFVFNDAWKDPTQHIIGQDFEFLLRAEAGVHVMLSEQVSLNLESGYQHISNACLAPRNAGLNNVGVAIGVTWYYGR